MSENHELLIWLLVGLAPQFQASTKFLACTGVPSWNFQPSFSVTVKACESLVSILSATCIRILALVGS